jgi:hypothetical protein
MPIMPCGAKSREVLCIGKCSKAKSCGVAWYFEAENPLR